MNVPQRGVRGILLHPQHCISAYEGAGMRHRGQYEAFCCPLNLDFPALRVQQCATEWPVLRDGAPSTLIFQRMRVQGCATEGSTRHAVAPSSVYFHRRLLPCIRMAETPESLRKSGERGRGRRRREERRVSEGRYDDFERSDEGGVKGLS